MRLLEEHFDDWIGGERDALGLPQVEVELLLDCKSTDKDRSKSTLLPMRDDV